MAKENLVSFGDEVSYPYVYLRDAEVREFLASPPIKASYVSLDIETYAKPSFKDHDKGGLLPQLSFIRLIQLFDGRKVYILDLLTLDNGYLMMDPEIVTNLLEFLESKNIIAFNGLFDLSHLNHVFLVHFNRMANINLLCTLVMYRTWMGALIPRPSYRTFSMSEVCEHILEIPLDKSAQKSKWHELELTLEQVEYSALDAIASYFLYVNLLPELESMELDDVYYLYSRASEAVCMMSITGCPFDEKKHEEITEKWRAVVLEEEKNALRLLNARLPQNIKELLVAKVQKKYKEEFMRIVDDYIESINTIGVDALVWMREELEEEEMHEEDIRGRRRALRRVIKNIDELLIKPSSAPKVGKWLEDNLDPEDLEGWTRTEKTNALKTGAEEFEENAHLTMLEPLVVFKKYSKLLGTYGDGMKAHILKGRIYPNYTLGATHTGRMSSYSPNLQNMPRDSEYRRLFTSSSEDHRLLCADFSQIELRIAAYLSGDEAMVDAYESGIDLHTKTGSIMARVPIEEVTKQHRQGAKATNFGLAYGAGATTLKRRSYVEYKIDMSQEEAEDIVRTHRESYPTHRKWQIRQARECGKTLKVTTHRGRIRVLEPEYAYTCSMNTPVQGCAAEIMLDAMAMIVKAIRENNLSARLINVIHDEVVVDTPIEEVPTMKKFIKKSMEDAFSFVFPEATTLGLVEVGEGLNWVDAK